jgi:hypothetical protein
MILLGGTLIYVFVQPKQMSSRHDVQPPVYLTPRERLGVTCRTPGPGLSHGISR